MDSKDMTKAQLVRFAERLELDNARLKRERLTLVAEIERLTLALRSRDEASVWQWLRDLMPRRAK